MKKPMTTPSDKNEAFDTFSPDDLITSLERKYIILPTSTIIKLFKIKKVNPVTIIYLVEVSGIEPESKYQF